MKSDQNKISGFTLIEMSLVMLIMGVMLAVSLNLYKAYLDNKSYEQTINNKEAVMAAIDAFRALNNRYPCPASLTAARGDVNYGRETNCADTSVAPGNCAGGICIEESVRTVDIGTTTASNIITPRVRVGALPFRQLSLSEGLSYDGYGNRLAYIVTERLTDSDNFDPQHGAISIVDPDDESLITPAGSAHFIVFSHGKNKAGGYNKAGNQIPCASGTDSENCDVDVQSVYVSAELSESTTSEYDDMMSFFAFEDAPLWQNSSINPFNIYQKFGGGVGLGFSPDIGVSQQGLEVQGIIRTQDNPLTATLEGNLQATSYCQDAPFSSECFETNLIAGQLDESEGMQCPSGQFMIGISNGNTVCADEYWATCPDGQFLIGIADGRIVCQELPQPPEEPAVDCPTEFVDLCGETRTLSTSAHDAIITVTAGASATAQYRCDDGMWSLLDESGTCSCAPITETQTLDCPIGFDGEIAQTRQYLCPQGEWTDWSDVSDTCVCVGAVDTISENCPDNMSGEVLLERNFNCTTEAWGAPVEVGNSCACLDQSETQGFPCENDFTGEIQRIRHLTCPATEWGDWIEIGNTCTCVVISETRQIACAEGQTGHMTEERTLECPTGTWSDWSFSSTTCTSNESICQWVTSGYVGSSSNPMDELAGTGCECGDVSSCSTSSSSGVYQNYNNCVCQ